MRRLLLVALLPVFTICAINSQVSFRPQVGINFPSLTEEIEEGQFEGNVGFQFGADLQLGGDFFIQPGVNFETTKLSIDDGNRVGEINVSRINIPIYVGLRIAANEDNTFGLRVFGGPNFAINVNEDLDASLTFIDADNVRDSQVSGVLGAGVDLSIFFLDVAYKFGITDYVKDINSDARIDLFFVNVGLRFGS